MEFLGFLLKVSVCLALFFAFYLLVLRRLTFFKFNRFYLLAALVLSFVIPQMQFTVEREVKPTPIAAEPVVLATDHLPVIMEGNVHNSDVGQPLQAQGVDWLFALPYLYWVVALGIFGIGIWRLYQLLKYTHTSTDTPNGLKMVVKNEGFTNCSFFNYVFIAEHHLTPEELQVLLRHEEVHAKQFHSVDKMIMIAIKAVLWFNPLAYLYAKALEDVHEFEADEMTSTNVGKASYAHLLLKLAVSKGINGPLIHNFVKSPVKKRIEMLFNQKSMHMKKLMYLLIIPIGLGMIWGFTVDVVDVLPKSVVEKKEFILVLDAGHGGKVNGAEVDGYKEKDIALTFTKKIKALAEAQGIKVLTTRENDYHVSMADRAKISGDYLLSIHVNSEPAMKGNGLRNGIEIFTPSEDSAVTWAKSNSMQYYLYEELKTVAGIKTAYQPIQKKLFLLAHAKAAGVVIEMGYLTNEQDRKVIIDEAKQDELAAAIVKGIIVYKDKMPIAKALEENNKGAMLPPNEDRPFIERIQTTREGGYQAEKIVLNTVSGEPINAQIVYGLGNKQHAKVWVYINDKLYTEEEALKFELSFIAKLPLKRGMTNASNYDIPAISNEKLSYLFWFGNEPKLSIQAAKNRAYQQKYGGKTINGQVVDFDVDANKVFNGFIVKTTDGDMVKAYAEIKYTKQIKAMIAKGDQVSIQVYNASYQKNSDYPLLTSYKLIKDGKLLFDKWPKTTVNKVPLTNEDEGYFNRQREKHGELAMSIIKISAYSDRYFNSLAKQLKADGFLLTAKKSYKNEKLTGLMVTVQSNKGNASVVWDAKQLNDEAQIIIETNSKTKAHSIKLVSKPSTTDPKLLSSSTLNVDVKLEVSYVKNGKMEIFGGILLAEDLTFDHKNKTVIAQRASFTTKDGEVLKGDRFNFDLQRGTYQISGAEGNIVPKKRAIAVGGDEIGYTAQDSVRVNKKTGMINFYGNASRKLFVGKYYNPQNK